MYLFRSASCSVALATDDAQRQSDADCEARGGALAGVKASDVSAAHSKTRTLALVADILGGTTLAMAGVTIVLGVTSGKSEPPKAATLTFHPRGLALGGSF